MRKFALSGALILAFILFGLHQRGLLGGDDQVGTLHANVSTPIPTPVISSTSDPNTTISETVTPTPQPSGQYKDGTYTGVAADAVYGNIQVQAIIQNGKLTAVNFLQAPGDRSTSIEINSQAKPLLEQEAIQAQSAQVDGVSGASDSSQAFIESLSSALSQAS